MRGQTLSNLVTGGPKRKSRIFALGWAEMLGDTPAPLAKLSFFRSLKSPKTSTDVCGCLRDIQTVGFQYTHISGRCEQK